MAAVAASVLRSRAGLAATNRGASFLFLGPTGVGKTELAKALAELLFGDEKLLIRLDMGASPGPSLETQRFLDACYCRHQGICRACPGVFRAKQGTRNMPRCPLCPLRH